MLFVITALCSRIDYAHIRGRLTVFDGIVARLVGNNMVIISVKNVLTHENNRISISK